MCRPEEMVGNQTTLPPMRRVMRTACTLSPPTVLFSAMPPKAWALTSARRPFIARTSIWVLWWWDLATMARIPIRAPSCAASTWSKRRGNGLGPEWTCMSTRPSRTEVMAGRGLMRRLSFAL